MNGLSQQDALHQTLNPNLDACLWMQAGVIDYKLCDRAYDCEHCPFDEAFHARAGQRSIFVNDSSRPISVQGCSVAPNLFYHPQHTWARVEDGGALRIGLDDFGQRLLGRAYSVSLPPLGKTLHQGSACLRLTHQSGFSALIAPISGRVKEVNSRLLQRPTLLNQDPYDQGWLMLIEPGDLKDCLKRLMYGGKVAEWIHEEIEKLRFLVKHTGAAVTTKTITMNDGGLLTPEFLRELTVNERRQVIHYFFPPVFDEPAESNNAIKFPQRR